jgi:hypothetical protein
MNLGQIQLTEKGNNAVKGNNIATDIPEIPGSSDCVDKERHTMSKETVKTKGTDPTVENTAIIINDEQMNQLTDQLVTKVVEAVLPNVVAQIMPKIENTLSEISAQIDKEELDTSLEETSSETPETSSDDQKFKSMEDQIKLLKNALKDVTDERKLELEQRKAERRRIFQEKYADRLTEDNSQTLMNIYDNDPTNAINMAELLPVHSPRKAVGVANTGPEPVNALSADVQAEAERLGYSPQQAKEIVEDYEKTYDKLNIK